MYKQNLLTSGSTSRLQFTSNYRNTGSSGLGILVLPSGVSKPVRPKKLNLKDYLSMAEVWHLAMSHCSFGWVLLCYIRACMCF